MNKVFAIALFMFTAIAGMQESTVESILVYRAWGTVRPEAFRAFVQQRMVSRDLVELETFLAEEYYVLSNEGRFGDRDRILTIHTKKIAMHMGNGLISPDSFYSIKMPPTSSVLDRARFDTKILIIAHLLDFDGASDLIHDVRARHVNAIKQLSKIPDRCEREIIWVSRPIDWVGHQDDREPQGFEETLGDYALNRSSLKDYPGFAEFVGAAVRQHKLISSDTLDFD